MKDKQPIPSLEVTQVVVGCFVAGMDSFRKDSRGERYLEQQSLPGAGM